MSKLFEDSAKRISRIIDYSEIKFDPLSIIGSGGFGKVYKGVLNGKEIGIKKITISDNDPNRNILLKFLEREIYTLKMLSHPNVIQFYGIAEKERSLFLLTELVSGGDLHWYIKNKNIDMTWRLRLKIARDIAASMAYLHDNGVIHRDLKSTNLLVAENWVIKVCDMGLARKMDKSEKSKMTICGTDDWMAPEVLIGEEYDASCDVFSFGMVLIELITRENLTPRIRNEDLGVDQKYFLSKVPSDCPKELLRLVSECCKVAPSGRPTAENIFRLLQYLLTNLQGLGSEDEPQLRSFKPPELHLPTPNKNNNNSGGSGSNDNSFDDFSFPRPYQPSNQLPPDESVLVSGGVDSSDFSFPRPYQSSNIKNNDSNGNSSNQDSNFSFPRPYHSKVVILNEKGEEEELIPLSQKDQLENELGNGNNGINSSISDEDEMKQLKSQYYSKFSFPRPYQSSSIISFNDTELLSFPRPYNPDIDNNNNSNEPLLEDPKYSFPRPYNTQTDESSSPSSPSLLEELNSKQQQQQPNSTTKSTPIIIKQSPSPIITPSIFKPTNSQRVINIPTNNGTSSRVQSIATNVQQTPSSIVKSTATAQPKPRSNSNPPKPSLVISNIINNNNNNNNIKPVAITIPSSNKVVNLKNSNNNNVKVNNSSDRLKQSKSNESFSNNNSVQNTSIVEQIIQNINNQSKVAEQTQIKITSPRNNNNDNSNDNNDDKQNTAPNNNVDTVGHRRSRSLDIKNSTKAIIRKFEELTRFSSQQSNMTHQSSLKQPQQSKIHPQQQDSQFEGTLSFGKETIVFEKLSTSPKIQTPSSLNSNSVSSKKGFYDSIASKK